MNFIRGRSLQSLLRRLLLVLALAAVVAVLVAWILSNSVSRTFSNYTEQSLPLLNALNQAEHQIEHITGLIRVLHLVDDSNGLEELRTSLRDAFDRLFVLNLRIERDLAGRYRDSSAYSQRAWDSLLFALLGVIDVEIESLGKQLALRRAFSEAELSMIASLEAFALFLSLAISDALSQQRAGETAHPALSALEASSQRIARLLARGANEMNAAQLDLLARAVGQEIRISTHELMHLESTELRRSLGEHVGALYDQAHGGQNFFQLRSRYLVQRDELRARLTIIQVKLEELRTLKQTLHTQIRSQESLSLTRLSEAVLEGTRWTTLLALTVILISAVTVLYAVPHFVLAPLRAATDAIKALGKGADAYTPFDTRLTELSAMDSALGTFRDNAQALRESEDALRHTNSELNESNQKLRTFVRVSSHDLKSPLRGISQLTELVEDDLEERDFDTAKHNLGRIRARAQSLFALLDSLLEYVRVDSSTHSLKTIDLCACVEEQLDLLRESGSAEVSLDCRDARVTLRPAPFLVMLRNLVDNAIKHHDGDQARVRVIMKPLNATSLQVQVEDNGPGIPTEYQRQVFEPFETLKPKQQTGGSGMGLAIIVRVIEAEGGTLRLDSPIHSDGRGCRFRVAWPLVTNEELTEA